MAKQEIFPERTLFFAGDTIRFTLTGIPGEIPGHAVVRTNLGNAQRQRKEQVEKAMLHRTPRGEDWHDIPMEPTVTPGSYRLLLPLPEVGIFEAKCGFIPDDGSPIIWPEGDNSRIKVLAAANAAGNGIYSAFVRQFGMLKKEAHSPKPLNLTKYDDMGCVIVPPSGTFRGLIAELDHIFGELRCRILQLLPIHPLPMGYGKMGRYGSPFAATDYFAVEPSLAEFDTKATPMDQFLELVDEVHHRRGRIFMDIPVNHTGWSSKLQCEHPDYFCRDKEGNFESPGAWGVVWGDLCKLDYSKESVRDLMAKVFLFWCRRGVDGFRCDAGYMVPSEAWEYIVARVRQEFPDTVFLLEGLGGPLETQEHLLSRVGLDWGYSELFQNYSRDEISRYYPYMNEAGNRCGTLANFAETHDNDRLAKQGKTYARLRFLVTALLSQHGTFGFVNGAEYFAEEKIDVHGCGGLNFGEKENLCALIGKLNTLLGNHPAFGVGVDVRLVQQGGGNVIAALRTGRNVPELLVLLNLDCSREAEVSFPARPVESAVDLLTGQEHFFRRSGNFQQLTLAPAAGLCLSFDSYRIPAVKNFRYEIPAAVCAQRAAAMAQRAVYHQYGMVAAAKADGKKMLADPEEFLSRISGISPAPLTRWHYPADCHRVVMVPPKDALLLLSPCAFILDLMEGKSTLVHMPSLPRSNGSGDMALIPILPNESSTTKIITLKITAFTETGVRRESAELMLLPPGEERTVRLEGAWNEADHHMVFGSNNLGGYSLFCAAWGTLYSKYDAILAANVCREYPVDRRIMFSGLRAWLVIDEFSQEITSRTLESYSAHPGNRASWHFRLPNGKGGWAELDIDFRMALDSDAVEFRFRGSGHDINYTSAKLILRPDLEDRVNHEVTRACDGPEQIFRAGVTDYSNGFDFHPGPRTLSLRISRGSYLRDPEWRYMVDLPAERYYGLKDKTDLFSPGYFTINAGDGDEVTLTAWVGKASQECRWPEWDLPARQKPLDFAVDSLSRFVVRRDNLFTVIAGYPWFLDWGRDTLIALRGLVKFPEFREKSAQILRRFAAFEKGGTIPNMICGANDSNRETSDAPLYLIVGVRDYIAESGDKNFLECDCGGRTLREVLHSIVTHYRAGCGNGIGFDGESGLIFSPAHFSWMDTNYPAGTPREGYPIEIQALWYAALEFLGEKDLAEKVSHSVEELFFSGGRFADCLHASKGTPAASAVPDDHIRCNMLTAVTMNAVHDPAIRRKILHEAEALLVPGGIRTLADAPVSYQLPVFLHGWLLNDPSHPYQGHYCGPEDTSRKVSYHNGTAWCWPFPAYCEALYLTGGEKVRARACALLLSCAEWLENGVIGEMPEVFDGDAPHQTGGCMAQAWSVSEFYRVLKILSPAQKG